jgi:hypothetical protein
MSIAMSVYEHLPERQAGESRSLASLMCFKCREGYVKLKIYPCKKGHLLCPECLVGRRHCCLCGKTFQKTRSIELEAMAEKLLKPCQWGCEKWMPPDKIEAHEKHCDLKKLSCVSLVDHGNCAWTGTRKDLTQHLLSEHSPIISNNFLHDFEIKNYSQFEEFSVTRLLTCFHHLFLAKLLYNGTKRAFYGKVHFVSGAPQVAKGFRYEFQIDKETKNNTAHYKFIFSRQAHRISEVFSDNDLSDRCDHFFFSKDIGSFFTDINDTLTVTVIIKSVQSLAMKNVEAQKTYGFVPSQYCQKCVGVFNPEPQF